MKQITATTGFGSDVAGRAYLDYCIRYVVTPADLQSGVYYIPVNAGAVVVGVRALVETAFNGTTPTVKVGDAADDDGFLKATDQSLTTVGSFSNSANLQNDYKGKYYASSAYLRATFSGSPTAGKLILTVVYDGYEKPGRDAISVR